MRRRTDGEPRDIDDFVSWAIRECLPKIEDVAREIRLTVVWRAGLPVVTSAVEVCPDGETLDVLQNWVSAVGIKICTPQMLVDCLKGELRMVSDWERIRSIGGAPEVWSCWAVVDFASADGPCEASWDWWKTRHRATA